MQQIPEIKVGISATVPEQLLHTVGLGKEMPSFALPMLYLVIREATGGRYGVGYGGSVVMHRERDYLIQCQLCSTASYCVTRTPGVS